MLCAVLPTDLTSSTAPRAVSPSASPYNNSTRTLLTNIYGTLTFACKNNIHCTIATNVVFVVGVGYFLLSDFQISKTFLFLNLS